MNPKTISVSSSGANEVIAAVSGRRIRVLGYVLVSDAAVKVKWQSGSTDISGLMNLAGAGYGVSVGPAGTSFDPIPVLLTAHGEALNLNLSGAVVVAGHLTYDLV